MSQVEQRAEVAPASRTIALEGVRAVSALAIVVVHAASFTGATSVPGGLTDGAGPWMQHLTAGVAVFFVLSGYLLFRPFVAADLAGRASPPVGPYLLRRLVRIFPAYWVALAVSAAVLDLQLGDGWSALRFYALIQIYWSDSVIGGLPHAWTLNTELAFYLFLPVWAAGLRRIVRRSPQPVTVHLAGLAVLFLVGIAVTTWLRARGARLGYGTLPANLDLFAIGMAMAVVAEARDAGARLPRVVVALRDQPGLSWLAALCCYASLVAMEWPTGFTAPTAGQELARELLVAAVATLFVLPAAFGDRGWPLALLRSRPLVAVGIVSYGVYLWHLPVLDLMVREEVLVQPSTWVLALLCLPPTLVLAAASWFGLERPLLRASHRWSAQRGATARMV